jgi:quercetin 2,3-dioxygenase
LGGAKMIQVRRGKERGHADHGWLNTYHTFSFSNYYDPKFMGFRSLRVINEDWVQPGYGFPTHPHRDMEIITYVLEGSLEHKDSMGTGSVIRPGEVQKMSAGTGVRHSEFNHSKEEPVHLYQIWILPEKEGIKPNYEQKAIPAEEKQGKLRLVASPSGGNGSNAVKLYQDAELYTVALGKAESVEHPLRDGRYAWVQVARGAVNVNGQELKAGDGAAVSNENKLEISGTADGSEVLLFDLA